MQDYEKLGAFYLGRQWDPASGKSEDGLVLYDSKDLVTQRCMLRHDGQRKDRPLYRNDGGGRH